MQKITFEDTTVVKSPYVTIDGVEYSVTNGTYQGGTDLNANTFNTMQNNIENAINSVETYSTTETVIGEYDGKTLYRKILKITPSEQYATYAHNIDGGLDKIINAYGYYIRSYSGYRNIIPTTYTGWEVWIYDFTGLGFSLRFSDNVWNNGISELQIILEYTKITD